MLKGTKPHDENVHRKSTDLSSSQVGREIRWTLYCWVTLIIIYSESVHHQPIGLSSNTALLSGTRNKMNTLLLNDNVNYLWRRCAPVHRPSSQNCPAGTKVSTILLSDNVNYLWWRSTGLKANAAMLKLRWTLYCCVTLLIIVKTCTSPQTASRAFGAARLSVNYDGQPPSSSPPITMGLWGRSGTGPAHSAGASRCTDKQNPASNFKYKTRDSL